MNGQRVCVTSVTRPGGQTFLVPVSIHPFSLSLSHFSYSQPTYACYVVLYFFTSAVSSIMGANLSKALGVLIPCSSHLPCLMNHLLFWTRQNLW